MRAQRNKTHAEIATRRRRDRRRALRGDAFRRADPMSTGRASSRVPPRHRRPHRGPPSARPARAARRRRRRRSAPTRAVMPAASSERRCLHHRAHRTVVERQRARRLRGVAHPEPARRHALGPRREHGTDRRVDQCGRGVRRRGQQYRHAGIGRQQRRRQLRRHPTGAQMAAAPRDHAVEIVGAADLGDEPRRCPFADPSRTGRRRPTAAPARRRRRGGRPAPRAGRCRRTGSRWWRRCRSR